ncbi:MAG TPA: hypothetical protein VEB22_04695, partial [Phycisphaerales bacterium]|nr:hypothetical protein [Phycisphaerales bacterium]
MAHGKRRNVSRSESRRKDPLIGPGGKVDPAALFRAAAEAAGDRSSADPSTAESAPPLTAPGVEEAVEDDDGDIITARPARTQRVSFTLTRDLDKRLDKYLVDRITFLSRNKLQELIDA